MSKLILAIDPGVQGAFALLDASTSEIVEVGDLPIIEDQNLKWVDGDVFSSDLLRLIGGRPTTAILERVVPQPKNGARTMLIQGMTFGAILSTLQLVRTRIEFVTPVVWKKSLGLVFPKEYTVTQRKHASLAKARLLFPTASLDRAKDNGRAEALLIGHWYLQTRVAAKAA